MIRYAAEKYGHDRVAQIITFGTLGAKASIRDVGRALGMTYADVDRVARAVPTMPASFGLMTIERALEEGADLRELYGDPQYRKMIDTAQALEGVARHASTPPRPDGPPHGRRRTVAADDPVRDERRGGAGPAEDGLPGAHQPHHPRQAQ